MVATSSHRGYRPPTVQSDTESNTEADNPLKSNVAVKCTSQLSDLASDSGYSSRTASTNSTGSDSARSPTENLLAPKERSMPAILKKRPHQDSVVEEYAPSQVPPQYPSSPIFPHPHQANGHGLRGPVSPYLPVIHQDRHSFIGDQAPKQNLPDPRYGPTITPAPLYEENPHEWDSEENRRPFVKKLRLPPVSLVGKGWMSSILIAKMRTMNHTHKMV
ncbi:uncharacterized protein K452DRAFT_125377 [Aplosporella prunicola CBS 121167]|uniref:Uncharacterized protein n=1 Tax=Aplosporella prunicola CBS 121167 TaxID=1176127 RepID=A0A6A6BNR1_9PEZI|nr:uncharacterized protein K452DRAFT_125377 [Aplosporella prunicola CBS 121167]KAF2145779.1 hypothetical protein K452DRAFT_125377 [Aplosporella prunicola CBS 121167]